MNNKLNVLIIEDDVSINDIEKRVLEKNGFGVIQAIQEVKVYSIANQEKRK